MLCFNSVLRVFHAATLWAAVRCGLRSPPTVVEQPLHRLYEEMAIELSKFEQRMKDDITATDRVQEQTKAELNDYVALIWRELLGKEEFGQSLQRRLTLIDHPGGYDRCGVHGRGREGGVVVRCQRVLARVRAPSASRAPLAAHRPHCEVGADDCRGAQAGSDGGGHGVLGAPSR